MVISKLFTLPLLKFANNLLFNVSISSWYSTGSRRMFNLRPCKTPNIFNLSKISRFFNEEIEQNQEVIHSMIRKDTDQMLKQRDKQFFDIFHAQQIKNYVVLFDTHLHFQHKQVLKFTSVCVQKQFPF